jgi:hypothetical protein
MMTYFVGLDVSQKMTAICVVDNAGLGLSRGQCPTPLQQIEAMVRRHAGDDFRIGIKTGAMTPWLMQSQSSSHFSKNTPGFSSLGYRYVVPGRGRCCNVRNVVDEILRVRHSTM